MCSPSADTCRTKQQTTFPKPFHNLQYQFHPIEVKKKIELAENSPKENKRAKMIRNY